MSSPPDHSVAILSAVRTPIGKYGGAVRSVPATRLGTVAAQAAIVRAGLAPSDIEEVLFGMAIQAGAGQNPARQVLRGAGVPDTTGAATINMVCGSGMKAIHLGYASIRAGLQDRVLVGGMESMSCAPYLLPGAMRWAHPPGSYTLEDSMQRDTLIDAYEGHELMGLTGERIAQKFNLTRADVDAFGLRSHLRAAAAVRDGTFNAETVPIPAEGSPDGENLAADESPRGDTTLEGLGRLRTAFTPDGVLTAGNSSRLSDGGAALVLASAAEVRRRGVTPLAWIHSVAESGVHPRDVMESPIPTVKRHLERTGLKPSDFDRVEHNEAYASASIAVQRTFGFTEEQFNVHGGAIALGHPIGASGARIVVTLAHELVRSRTSLGLATLCMGGGNGLSIAIDREGL
ncbi:MAG: thiolase family protein [Thermoplasmata archaeon]|jgi:acetyl-CoA C-acetyltransferase